MSKSNEGVKKMMRSTNGAEEIILNYWNVVSIFRLIDTAAKYTFFKILFILLIYLSLTVKYLLKMGRFFICEKKKKNQDCKHGV